MMERCVCIAIVEKILSHDFPVKKLWEIFVNAYIIINGMMTNRW